MNCSLFSELYSNTQLSHAFTVLGTFFPTAKASFYATYLKMPTGIFLYSHPMVVVAIAENAVSDQVVYVDITL